MAERRYTYTQITIVAKAQVIALRESARGESMDCVIASRRIAEGVFVLWNELTRDFQKSDDCNDLRELCKSLDYPR